jgi:hypothetical protein
MGGTTSRNFGTRLAGLRQLTILLASACLLQGCGGTSESADTSAELSAAGDDIAQGKASSDRLRRTRNKAPSIAGTPLTQVQSGQAYSFSPAASDPNGDPITFAIANKPAWASFNTATGALTGTPVVTATTRTVGVTISVSDGRVSSSLTPFDIEVVAAAPPVANNRATVQWNAPTTNSDGTNLTNLAGFKLYYGKTAAALDQMVQIASPYTTQQVVENLASGTWYFAVSAVNAAGLESQLSALASRSYP